ncbi:hypothetical protein TI04_05515 [Achromatium sp. WMS2]|nr:hypothetical protein TI04_05515 [Achromatium sp. WMS2]
MQDVALPPTVKPVVKRLAVPDFVAGVNLKNTNNVGIWYSLAVGGSPLAPPAALASGLTVERHVFDVDGNNIDDQDLEQGTTVIVVLKGEVNTQNIEHQALIVDALPAGLEIENPSLAAANSVNNLGWIGYLTTLKHSEILDDRFVVALDLKSGSSRTFKIAYMARAVTPGRYWLPPVTIEDMYKPWYRGRSGSGRLVVTAK